MATVKFLSRGLVDVRGLRRLHSVRRRPDAHVRRHLGRGGLRRLRLRPSVAAAIHGGDPARRCGRDRARLRDATHAALAAPRLRRATWGGRLLPARFDRLMLRFFCLPLANTPSWGDPRCGRSRTKGTWRPPNCKLSKRPRPSGSSAGGPEELERAGYDPRSAAKIAIRPDIDLHAAVDLLARGCAPDLALKILL